MTTPAAMLAPYRAGLPVPQPRQDELARRLTKTPSSTSTTEPTEERMMNRRTSAYALRVHVPKGDPNPVLDAVVLSLPAGVLVTDRHTLTDSAAHYVSVSFRATDDEAATATARETLDRLYEDHPDAGATLLTGHGVHRRTVHTWEQEGPRRIAAASVRPGDTIKTSGTPEDEPVTLTVVGGGWTDVDPFGNWVDPQDPEHPTHVYLDGEGDDESLLLPVTQPVWLIRREGKEAGR